MRMKKILILLLTVIQLNSFGQEVNREFVFADTIQSQYLAKSQVIHIYLPPDYYHSKDDYPLQVVLGGYSRTRLYYAMNEYLSKTYQILDLNHLHTIPESIIVGLSTAPPDNFENYNKFIVHEVVPFVELHFRKTNYKVLVGHSSDGEFVLHDLLNCSSPFHGYFCSAPTNSDYFVEQLMNQEVVSWLQKSKKTLFLGASEQDYFYTENLQLVEALRNNDAGRFSFRESIKTSDTHHTIFPDLMSEALFYLYKSWYFSFPESDPQNTTELFVAHYDNLSQKTGIAIVPPEFDFYLLAYILNSKKLIDEKIELLKKCKEFYPEAENADAYLARTYYSSGDLQKAEKYNDFALKINSQNGFAIQTKELIEKTKR